MYNIGLDVGRQGLKASKPTNDLNFYIPSDVADRNTLEEKARGAVETLYATLRESRRTPHIRVYEQGDELRLNISGKNVAKLGDAIRQELLEKYPELHGII